MYNDRGILTIAYGKKYVNQAKYLSYSCMLHTADTLRAVITDSADELSRYYDIIVPFPEGKNPFFVKTTLYRYTPFKKTLYIDADSLVMNDIESFWDSLNHYPFVYNGNKETSGNWYFNINEMVKKINVPWIPVFNSGMFLFNNSNTSKEVFECANNLMINYKDTEIVFFRDKMLPDEPFFSITFAKLGIEPYNDHYRFSRSLIDANKINIDVIKGIAYYYKDNRPIFPLIVHFCGKFGNLIYIIQKIKLFFYFKISITNIIFKFAAHIRNKIKSN